MNKLSTGILIGLLAVANAFASSNRYHPNHLFIKMKDGKNLIKSSLIQSSKQIIPGLYLVKTKSADSLASSLKGNDSIEYTQNDFYAGAQKMPKLERLDTGFSLKRLADEFNMDFGFFDDPQTNKLWAFTEEFGLDVLGAYKNLPEWTPQEVVVAVVDTGVDHNHEDLEDVMWTNKNEIPGDGIDNDKNGYVDDIHGINTLVRDAQGRATSNTQASHWHGTHVAGTIAATQNNRLGISGVAHNVKIMAIRTVPDNADELDSDVAEAYQYAAKMGAKVINCSFGKDHNEGGMVVRDVINEIGKKYGTLVVASAGNDSSGPFSWHNNDEDPKFPASFDSENLLVIASTTSSGKLSSFSNIGAKTVDVASPGSNIYSTMPNGQYGMASGTSMAAPNASGVAAMVMGYFPDLTVTEIKEVLKSSVTKVPSFADKMTSGGRLNLKSALKKAKQMR